MKNRDFETQLLEIAFHSNERLTPHFVAYKLGIPFAEAKSHLDRSVKEGLLTFEYDDSGNAWYDLPGVERPKQNVQAGPIPVMPKVSYVTPRRVATPRSFGVRLFSVARAILWGFIIFSIAKFLLFPLLLGGVFFLGLVGPLLFPLFLILGITSLFRVGAARHARRFPNSRQPHPKCNSKNSDPSVFYTHRRF